MTARQWLDAATARLKKSGAPDARLDARWMLADALGVGLGFLMMRMEDVLAPDALAQMDEWLCARESGIPLQYAQGRAYFMGHEFLSDARALIPRADTELLCEAAIERAGPNAPGVLDLCTGSGAIAISIALARPDARVTASDLSRDALFLAEENAARLNARVTFVAGDFFEAVAGQRFDVIACNPPYLDQADMAHLQSEVAYEPALALDGGADGLDFYRRAAQALDAHLTRDGWALFEVGQGQARAVARLLGGECTILKDLGGIERVVARRAIR
ncbi:MAG: peptide chain release factor N(5)-glutamine methyltransferase [Clostridia bacterium]